MTTMTHETEIGADAKVPVIRITREFDASPAKVFRAHTDPELVAQWLGPRDWPCSAARSPGSVWPVPARRRRCCASREDGFSLSAPDPASDRAGGTSSPHTAAGR
jgi:hypothetical protein